MNFNEGDATDSGMPGRTDMQLAGKVALITGASSGIGLATASLLARQGAKVALLGHTAETVEQQVRDIQQWGMALPLVADVSDPEAMRQAVEKLVVEWGHLDIVFANAGINGVWAPIEDLSLEAWDKTLSVNLTGTFLTVKFATPYLKRQGGSVVINSSVNGTRMFSNTGATAYACSKAAQVAFTKMMALELAKFRVRVNVICPGAISTEMISSTKMESLDSVKQKVEYPEGAIPLSQGQLGTAEQVAQLVLFLSLDASSHITGTEIWIDGGQSLLQG
jgi:NAD(P)-dependent dehydrogenase (short-subunit alcohol dehydrogenase family)